MKKKLSIWLATGFGLGFSPVASGTAGTILGIPLAVAILPLPWVWQVVVAVLLALAAIPICDVAEKHFGKKDDGRIVADEYLTFPLCLIGLPWGDHLWLLPVAFLTSRVLDIIKPQPARAAQDLGGGLGIVMDDIISSSYALALNHLIFLTVCRFWIG